jgi:hypothetical protein
LSDLSVAITMRSYCVQYYTQNDRLVQFTMSSPSTETTPEAAPAQTTDVVDVTVHPLVLLSAADHYHRVARGTRKRVVGVLLGSVSRGKVDATNSFALPFEEDSKNPVSKSLEC